MRPRETAPPTHMRPRSPRRPRSARSRAHTFASTNAGLASQTGCAPQFATSAHVAPRRRIGPPLLGALTECREVASTKAVTTASTPGLPLEASSGRGRRGRRWPRRARARRGPKCPVGEARVATIGVDIVAPSAPRDHVDGSRGVAAPGRLRARAGTGTSLARPGWSWSSASGSVISPRIRQTRAREPRLS